ncbi:hypothetical protein [Pseudomonas pharyngis]|uniref:hypothetical protein n=1 Tax=Pseudomonas pharyngis TaxID=2892333 RepID=UPI001F16087E|nr:hypothetical protein [Pseudomonas pharyngis]
MMRNIQTREGFEFWDKLNALPRYAFLLSPSGKSVQKFEDQAVGNWIDVHEAQKVVDQAQDEINQFRAERDALQLLLNAVDQRKDDFESLLEQVLTNADRGLPSELQRSIRQLLPAREAPPPANEAEREPFEAWHRRRFATRHSNGQPTRDMHNGIRDPNYGPPGQQNMWEAWQARAELQNHTGDATEKVIPRRSDQLREHTKMIAARNPEPDFSMIGIVHTPPMEYDEP